MMTQIIGRADRYGMVPKDVNDMKITIFAGEWQRKICCKLFTVLAASEDMYNNVASVTIGQGKMYEFESNSCSSTA